MRIVTSVAAMQRLARGWRQKKARVAFVPTMGFLHEGHQSLIRRARQSVGKSGRVVVSIYVNPTQFGPKEDLFRYPRDLKGDCKRCRESGVDVVFAPDDGQVYPGSGSSAHSTYVVEESLSLRMEGASRPGHFRGVATVVAKLFNIVQPDVAVFGSKDYQQAAVIRRMVRDLNFPVGVIVAPTWREADGLAMSSRNKYLTPEERPQATVLWRAIRAAVSAVRDKPVSSARLKSRLARLIAAEPAARLEYVEFFDPDTLQPVATVRLGAHMALAVFIGTTRLIDNARME